MKKMFAVLAAILLLVVMACSGGGGDGGSSIHTYKVIYNDNGSTGGSVPIDSHKYQEGDNVTVPGNTGSLVKTGYIFVGWNMQADGNGTTYTEGQDFRMGTANVTLYAKFVTTPLSEFYGLMTLHYKFDISSTIYTDTAHFSSANLNADKTIVTAMVVGSSSRAISCSAYPSLRSHMCIILNGETGIKEFFLFNLNNGQITNGLYEYCLASTTTYECTNEVLASPDGTAWGTVESAKKSEILFNESNTTSDYASKATIKLNIDEVNAIDQGLSFQQQQVVDELSTRMEALSNQASHTLE